jgi:fermentation-respiration switch protein FrsA (DUF1100 family)
MKLLALRWAWPLYALRNALFWRRSWKHRMGRYALEIGFWYLVIVALLAVFENRLLYHPSPSSDWSEPPDGLHAEDVEFVDGTGVRIHGWWCVPEGWTPSHGAMIYCHGNAGNVSHRGSAIVDWQRHFDHAVLIFDYPGFGRSEGSPSEAGCYASADAAYDWVVNEKKVSPESIVLFGGSLGGGVMVDLASRRSHRALVLLSTFTSIPEVAQRLYFWAPVRYIARNRFPSLSKIRLCQGPIFIAHGTADRLIPMSQGERLFAEANEPKAFFAMDGVRHDETITPACFQALKQFLVDNPPVK